MYHQKCKLAVGSIDYIVAVGYVEDVYCLTVHRILGDDNYRVAVEVAFVEDDPLLIPNKDIGATLVARVIGSFVT